MKSEILKYLPKEFPWEDNIHYFESIDSTNTYAKHIANQGAAHGTVVLAGSQTAGRGRMGRSFHSSSQRGIYLSVILRPNCPADQLMHLTCAVGVAVCDAINTCTGTRPGIKWINDIVLDRKKIGGILTELSVRSDGYVEYAVIGIGINCNQNEHDFPEALQEIATSLFMATKQRVSLPKLTASIIYELRIMAETLLTQKSKIIQSYVNDCITLQKDVVIHTSQCTKNGFACGIDESGALLVRFPDGTQEAISSGEASVRGMYGYT